MFQTNCAWDALVRQEAPLGFLLLLCVCKRQQHKIGELETETEQVWDHEPQEGKKYLGGKLQECPGQGCGLQRLDRAFAVNDGSIWQHSSSSSKWKQPLNFFLPSGPKSTMQVKPLSGTLAKITTARLLYHNNLCCSVIPKVTIITQMVTDS